MAARTAAMPTTAPATQPAQARPRVAAQQAAAKLYIQSQAAAKPPSSSKHSTTD
jgi:hypothetical protein